MLRHFVHILILPRSVSLYVQPCCLSLVMSNPILVLALDHSSAQHPCCNSVTSTYVLVLEKLLLSMILFPLITLIYLPSLRPDSYRIRQMQSRMTLLRLVFLFAMFIASRLLFIRLEGAWRSFIAATSSSSHIRYLLQSIRRRSRSNSSGSRPVVRRLPSLTPTGRHRSPSRSSTTSLPTSFRPSVSLQLIVYFCVVISTAPVSTLRRPVTG